MEKQRLRRRNRAKEIQPEEEAEPQLPLKQRNSAESCTHSSTPFQATAKSARTKPPTSPSRQMCTWTSRPQRLLGCNSLVFRRTFLAEFSSHGSQIRSILNLKDLRRAAVSSCGSGTRVQRLCRDWVEFVNHSLYSIVYFY